MIAKTLRAIGLAALGAVGLWLGRLVAHSKVPAPEGKWQEVGEDSLS